LVRVKTDGVKVWPEGVEGLKTKTPEAGKLEAL
jgi:hypothetical protein